MPGHCVLDALQNGDVSGRGAVIVADEGGAAVGVGADNADGACRIRVEGQQAVVFQQDAGTARRSLRQSEMLLALHRLVWNIVKLAAPAHYSQQVTGGE